MTFWKWEACTWMGVPRLFLVTPAACFVDAEACGKAMGAVPGSLLHETPPGTDRIRNATSRWGGSDRRESGERRSNSSDELPGTPEVAP